MVKSESIDHIPDIAAGQPPNYADASAELITRGATLRRGEFLAPGTLDGPGPIGRVVRAALGLGALYFAIDMVAYRDEVLGSSAPSFLGWYLGVAIALWVTSDVVNVGLGRHWGYRPLLFVAAAFSGALALDIMIYGSLWAPPAGVVLLLWMVPVFAYLGGSMLLASLLGTPGCEMRAVPDLRGRLSGHPHVEHACPGPLYAVDRWEQDRAQRSRAT